MAKLQQRQTFGILTSLFWKYTNKIPLYKNMRSKLYVVSFTYNFIRGIQFFEFKDSLFNMTNSKPFMAT